MSGVYSVNCMRAMIVVETDGLGEGDDGGDRMISKESKESR